ncbi:MAG: chromate efflux transporter [Pseudomonadota bacterium]
MSAPTLTEALRVYGRIGVLSFGGPAAQIALMHKELVEDRPWLTEKQYLNALSFCMLLPGPEAMQLATYAGWRLHGVRGGLAAGLLFVLPGALFMLLLAGVYAAVGAAPLAEALFLGVKAAVVVIVIQALRKVAGRALDGAAHWVIAALAFVAIFVFALPFPLIVAAAAAYGFLFSGGAEGEAPPPPPPRSGRAALITAVIWLAIWIAPLLAVGAASGMLAEIGAFFSRLAVVTFGGAYAVLAYMAQEVVADFGWLQPGEMLDGLGLAETTPGPLILVTEFVGFLAAEKAGGFWFGVAGAAVALWATFAPCFLWIFVGAPYIDWIGTQPRLRGALSAITAAVVGVILNLTIWFALHVFFTEVSEERAGPLVLWTPALASFDARAAALTALCALLMLRFKWGLATTLGLSAALGVIASCFV